MIFRAIIFVMGLMMLVHEVIPVGKFPFAMNTSRVPSIATRACGLCLILFVLFGHYLLGIAALVLLFTAMVASLSGKVK